MNSAIALPLVRAAAVCAAGRRRGCWQLCCLQFMLRKPVRSCDRVFAVANYPPEVPFMMLGYAGRRVAPWVGPRSGEPGRGVAPKRVVGFCRWLFCLISFLKVINREAEVITGIYIGLQSNTGGIRRKAL